MSKAELDWVLCRWSPSHDPGPVFAADRDALAQLGPAGRVFAVIGIDGRYRVLRYGDASFRVAASALQSVRPPRHAVGDDVRIVAPDDIGTVVDIHWHHDQDRCFYLLAVNGKRKSRRYWDEELAATHRDDAALQSPQRRVPVPWWRRLLRR